MICIHELNAKHIITITIIIIIIIIIIIMREVCSICMEFETYFSKYYTENNDDYNTHANPK